MLKKNNTDKLLYEEAMLLTGIKNVSEDGGGA